MAAQYEIGRDDLGRFFGHHLPPSQGSGSGSVQVALKAERPPYSVQITPPATHQDCDDAWWTAIVSQVIPIMLVTSEQITPKQV